MRKKHGITDRPTLKPRRPSAAKPVQTSPNAPSEAGSAPPKTLAASGPKSLMKTSALGGAPDRRLQATPSSASVPAQRRKPAPGNISGVRQQKIEERIAAATEELSAGITEAASAAEELRRSMEQIASGAEEAASAAQETLAVATDDRDNASARTRPVRGRAAPDRRAGDAADRNLEPDRDLGQQHQA